MSTAPEAIAALVDAPVEAPDKPAASSDRDPPQPTEAQLDKFFGPDPDAKVAKESAKAEESKEEEQPEEKAAQDEERDAIVQRLITSGVPAGVVKNASWADLQRWDKVAAKREADIQSAFQERADLKKQLEKLSKEATARPSEPSSGVPTEGADLKGVYSDLLDAFGPDLEKPLAKFSEQLLAKAVAHIEAKYADTIGELSGGSSAAQEMLLETTRERLVERFPELSDDTKFGKVLEKMGVLAQTGAYNDTPTARARARSCMEDACGLVFKAKPEADRNGKQEVSRARNNGQPLVRSTNPQKRALATEERALARFMAREDGASDDEVNRIG